MMCVRKETMLLNMCGQLELNDNLYHNETVWVIEMFDRDFGFQTLNSRLYIRDSRFKSGATEERRICKQ